MPGPKEGGDGARFDQSRGGAERPWRPGFRTPQRDRAPKRCMRTAASPPAALRRPGGPRRRPRRDLRGRRRGLVPVTGSSARRPGGACAGRHVLRLLAGHVMANPPIQALHVFPTFAPGGAQVRATDLMVAFGPEWKHAVVALDGVVRARELVRQETEL